MRYLKLNFDYSNSERPDFSTDMTAELCVTLKTFRLDQAIKEVPLRARSALHVQQDLSNI